MSEDEPVWRTPSNQEWAESKARAREFKARLRAARLDQREWIGGVRRRLGLVAEVHRCHVERSVYGPQWAWSCARSDCGEFRVYRPTQAVAFAEALAHARSFVPQPPGPEPWTELDALAFEAAWDAVQEEQARIAAALPVRMAEVTEQVNTAFAGVLPDGLRFEWRADGE